jgi:purine-binding chemotaxis protein CheW
MGDRPQGPVDFEALRRRLDESERGLTRADATTPERRQEILAARARSIAGARDEVRPESMAVLAFGVAGERYAVGLDDVSQVLEAKGISPLPGAPRWLLGAMIARSRVVPVLDLRQILGLEGGGLSDLTRVVVVEEDGDVFGLAVETLEGRQELPLASLSRPASGPFRWLAPDRLAVLDLARIEGGPAGATGAE